MCSPQQCHWPFVTWVPVGSFGPTLQSHCCSLSHGTGWNGPIQTVGEGCLTVPHPGNLGKVAGGRVEAKTPFLSRISLLTGHSKAEAVCWGCAGTSSQPRALVRPKGSHGERTSGASLGLQLSQGAQDSSSFRKTSPSNSHFAGHCCQALAWTLFVCSHPSWGFKYKGIGHSCTN